MSPRRGSTLVEAMVAVAVLGVGGGLALQHVAEARSSAALTLRAARALSCAQDELERLRLEPAAALRRRMGELPPPEHCEAPRPKLRLRAASGANVPEGTFVLEVSTAPSRTVELPFLAAPGGGK